MKQKYVYCDKEFLTFRLETIINNGGIVNHIVKLNEKDYMIIYTDKYKYVIDGRNKL